MSLRSIQKIQTENVYTNFYTRILSLTLLMSGSRPHRTSYVYMLQIIVVIALWRGGGVLNVIISKKVRVCGIFGAQGSIF